MGMALNIGVTRGTGTVSCHLPIYTIVQTPSGLELWQRTEAGVTDSTAPVDFRDYTFFHTRGTGKSRFWDEFREMRREVSDSFAWGVQEAAPAKSRERWFDCFRSFEPVHIPYANARAVQPPQRVQMRYSRGLDRPQLRRAWVQRYRAKTLP